MRIAFYPVGASSLFHRPVAHAADGLNLKIRVIHKAVAKPCDVHVHSVGVGVGIVAPDVIHQLEPSERLAWIGQQLEQYHPSHIRREDLPV